MRIKLFKREKIKDRLTENHNLFLPLLGGWIDFPEDEQGSYIETGFNTIMRVPNWMIEDTEVKPTSRTEIVSLYEIEAPNRKDLTRHWVVKSTKKLWDILKKELSQEKELNLTIKFKGEIDLNNLHSERSEIAPIEPVGPLPKKPNTKIRLCNQGAQEALKRYTEGIPPLTLAADYKVSELTIQRALCGKTRTKMYREFYESLSAGLKEALKDSLREDYSFSLQIDGD